jgi:hypothetical protein
LDTLSLHDALPIWLEKETRCVPQPPVSRRDLLRKCQARNGYCKHSNMYSGNKNKILRKRKHHSKKYYI